MGVDVAGDELNRTTALKGQGSTELASYAYDDLSRRTTVTLGTATSYGYDPNRRLRFCGLAPVLAVLAYKRSRIRRDLTLNQLRGGGQKNRGRGRPHPGEFSDVLPSGDFCLQNYPPACLFARLLRCVCSYIARLGSCCRALKTTENPTRSGSFVSANRLTGRRSHSCTARFVYLFDLDVHTTSVCACAVSLFGSAFLSASMAAVEMIR